MNFNVISPKTRSELLKTMKRQKNFRFGAGFTDLLLDLKKQDAKNITIINLAQLNDKLFHLIKKTSSGLRIGSLATAALIMNNQFIKKNFPVLQQAANNLASPQIREVATIGGNLCNASPSADMACALVALKSNCEILSSGGKKITIPINDFFKGPGKTALEKDEVLTSVFIPFNKNSGYLFSGFIKIGTRRSMECSVVSLAYHIQTDKNIIIEAGISIGSVAPAIRYVADAGNFLKGKNIPSVTQKEKEKFAQYVIQNASPISDLRATAWYRKEVLFNISKSIFENQNSLACSNGKY